MTRLIIRCALTAGLWLAFASPSLAQTVLSNTTLAAAMTATAQTLTLASASASAQATVGAPAVGQQLWVERELMLITAISGVQVTVARGQGGTAAAAHPTSSIVMTGPANAYRQADPAGGFGSTCTIPSMGVRPWINVINGNVWICTGTVWRATNIMNITYNSTTVY